MPELSIEMMQQCKQLKRVVIEGSKDNKYMVTDPHSCHAICDCKGFQYRRKCKHIEQAKAEGCQYHEQFDGAPEKDGVCPICGDETEYVRVGV